MHTELGRHDVEALGCIFADAMELAGTARKSVALDVDYHLDPRQMRRQRAAVRAALASPGGFL